MHKPKLKKIHEIHPSKRKRSPFRRPFLVYLNSFNLAASQAMSTNVNASMSSVNNGSDLLYVGLPSMVGSSVGMGYSLTESYALSANFTLCHISYLQVRIKRQTNSFSQFYLRLYSVPVLQGNYSAVTVSTTSSP